MVTVVLIGDSNNFVGDSNIFRARTGQLFFYHALARAHFIFLEVSRTPTQYGAPKLDHLVLIYMWN